MYLVRMFKKHPAHHLHTYQKTYFQSSGIKEDTPLNIVTMAEKDWTRLLTEDYLTMTVVSDTGSNSLPHAELSLQVQQQTGPGAGQPAGSLACLQISPVFSG